MLKIRIIINIQKDYKSLELYTKKEQITHNKHNDIFGNTNLKFVTFLQGFPIKMKIWSTASKNYFLAHNILTRSNSTQSRLDQIEQKHQNGLKTFTKLFSSII